MRLIGRSEGCGGQVRSLYPLTGQRSHEDPASGFGFAAVSTRRAEDVASRVVSTFALGFSKKDWEGSAGGGERRQLTTGSCLRSLTLATEYPAEGRPVELKGDEGASESCPRGCGGRIRSLRPLADMLER